MTKHRRRRLLIVVVEFPPLGGGGVLRITKLVKYLSRLDWEITVVCSDEPVALMADPSLLRDVPDSVRVHRIKGPFRFLGGPAGTIVQRGARQRLLAVPLGWAKGFVRSLLIPDRWIGWAWRVGRLDLNAEPPDIILSSGPPHSAHIAGRKLAARFRVPHVIDLRDDWAANPLHQNPLPWHDPLDAAVERRTVGRAAAIVVVSEAARDVYSSLHPRLAARIRVISNGFDPEDIPARAEAPRSGPLVFLHAGSLRNNARRAGPFFAAFGRHLDRNGTSLLELLGPISQEHEAAARRAIPADHLRIGASVEHAEALRRMSIADVLVVVTSEAEAGPATLTGKIFEYLAVRRPILMVGPPGPGADLIRNTGSGVFADPNDPPAIESAIDSVAVLARDRGFIGAPNEALRRFDRSVLARRWAELFEASLGKHEAESAGGPL